MGTPIIYSCLPVLLEACPWAKRQVLGAIHQTQLDGRYGSKLFLENFWDRANANEMVIEIISV